MKSAVFICCLKALLLLFSLNSVAYAETAKPVKDTTPTVTMVESKIREITDSITKDDETKSRLLERYQQILNYLAAKEKHENATAVYLNAIKNDPQETRKLIQELESLTDKKHTSVIDKVTDQTPLAELEQLLISEKANLAAVEAKKNELKQQTAAAPSRTVKIRNRLTEINKQLEQLAAEQELSSVAQSIEMKQANKWLNISRTAALKQELKSLDQELLSQPIRINYMNAQYDMSRHKLNWISSSIDELEQAVNSTRDREAQESLEQSREARQLAAGKHPLIQNLADKNSTLSEQISSLSEQLSRLTTKEDEINSAQERLSREFKSTEKKLEIAGLSQTLGPILFEQKNRLPDEHAFEKEAKSLELQIARAGLLRLQHNDDLQQLNNMDAYLENLTTELTQQERQKIQPDLKNLVSSREQLLKKLTEVESTYIRTLDDVNFAAKKLQQVVNDYNQLLEKQLFWMRSSPVISWEGIKDIPKSLLQFLRMDNWLGASRSLLSSLHESSIRVVGILLALLLFLKSSHIRQLLLATGKNLRKISSDKFSYTIKAIFYTFLLALPWPLITAFTGQQLKLGDEQSIFTQSLAAGLIWIVMPFLYLTFFREMCLPGGVADIHFRWRSSVVQGFRRALGRLRITFLPAFFFAAVILNYGIDTTHEVARLVMIVTLLAFNLFFYRLIKRHNGILAPLIKENPEGLLSRFYNFWLFLVIIDFVSLLVLILMGYVYTGGFILRNLIDTVWFIFALIFVQQLILRWLLLSRRKLALKAAVERRKAAQALKEAQQNTDETEQQVSLEVVEPEIDLISLSNESNKLLKIILLLIGVFGLAGIWAEVLPALTIFDDISLWHQIGIVNGEEKLLPVTLGDVGLGLLVLLLTYIGVKHLPSIIDIILLQQPSISSGSRYTVKTLTRYAIIGIGTFATLNIMGAEWAKLQWLFAALGVGIGFGLQEIVANFISGIIILFERPIRVGDYVSVGENEGIVSNISIRATTILTFDRKELLVPNKEFITGQLLNWSLSDPTTRIIIPVGVAYGSDIPKARQLLLQTAEENERVLADPAPRVIFYSFGDNTLDMQLRCFIADVDQRLSTISDLNEAINSKFNTAGICIAFPQRDVHLDLEQPIDIRLHKSMPTD